MLEIALVALIAVGALVLFVRETLPPEVVAILVLASLAAFGLVTTAQALSGFANEATITVAAMFVLSAGLRETGALDRVGRALVSVGVNGPLLLLATVVCVCAISAFINNTATVAVMLPIALAAARKRRVSPSKLLIPLSYASQIGGVCTLIGTSTNLLVNSLTVGAGHAGFGLFDFAPVGLALVATGALYFVAVGWWLLPSRPASASIEETYALRDYVFALQVPAVSRLVGRSVAQVGAARAGGVAIVELLRDGRRLIAEPRLAIAAGDVLLVEGQPDEAIELARREALVIGRPDVALEGDDVHLVELVVPPTSRAVGRVPAEIGSPWSARAVPLAIASRGDVRHDDLAGVRLVAGDVMLLLAVAADVAAIREDPDFIVLSARSSPAARARRAPLAVGIVAAVVGLAASGLAPIAIVALLGACATVVTGCLPLDRAYRSIELRVLVLLAAMLPLGIALETSGAARGLVTGVLTLLPDDPLVALAVVYGLTMLLTEFVSNTATAVLMTPIALALATQLGVSPTPFVAAVAFAASTSFSTPIGYQTNSMVYTAGGYAFRDFIRVGMPLNVLFWVVSVAVIPRVFPF
jgi:di/tricarboxylate transporter